MGQAGGDRFWAWFGHLSTQRHLFRAEIAFLYDPFVRLAQTFDLIFELALSLGQLPGHHVCAGRGIAIEYGRLQIHGLTELEFVRALGTLHCIGSTFRLGLIGVHSLISPLEKPGLLPLAPIRPSGEWLRGGSGGHPGARSRHQERQAYRAARALEWAFPFPKGRAHASSVVAQFAFS